MELLSSLLCQEHVFTQFLACTRLEESSQNTITCRPLRHSCHFLTILLKSAGGQVNLGASGRNAAPSVFFNCRCCHREGSLSAECWATKPKPAGNRSDASDSVCLRSLHAASAGRPVCQLVAGDISKSSCSPAFLGGGHSAAALVLPRVLLHKHDLTTNYETHARIRAGSLLEQG